MIVYLFYVDIEMPESLSNLFSNEQTGNELLDIEQVKFYWKSIFSLYLFLDDVSVIAIAPSIKQLQ